MFEKDEEHSTPGEGTMSARFMGRTSRLSGVWGNRAGKVRPMILLWALGVPLPLILIIVLIRGCMG